MLVRVQLLCMILAFSRNILPTISFALSPGRRAASTRPLRPSWRRNMASSPADTAADPLRARGLPTPLILGSASYTRKLILKEMAVPYHILVRPIDEKGLGDRSMDAPAALVLTLGQAKMAHLVAQIAAGACVDDLPSDPSMESMVLLTADQVVTCQGEILEKPESIAEARSFVARYGAHAPSTVGSCVLHHWPSGLQVAGVDTATIHFSPDTPGDLVDRLVAAGEPVLSCAGGLMVEHPAVKEYITGMDGTEDSVMGLSKALVLRLLDELAALLQEPTDPVR
jgi:septum formation protein